MNDEEPIVRVKFDALQVLLRSIFVNAGTSEHTATVLSENCAGCERDGALSHGIFRIPGYVDSLKSGWVNGHAEPRTERVTESLVRVDAKNGFSQIALAAAGPTIRSVLASTGVAVVAIRDSHHFSALWPDVEPWARSGFVALTFVNGLANVVPYGGRTAVYGTNPMAFAVPAADRDPLVIDQASSTMANGELRLLARANRTAPVGTGIDRSGNPSTDPGAILAGGALNPFGGHKGSSIALMVEILAAAFTGGQFSFENDFGNYLGAQTPRAGQLLIVMDPQRGGNVNFSERVTQLLSMVIASGQQRLPGERRVRVRKEAEAMGIPIAESTLSYLINLARASEAAKLPASPMTKTNVNGNSEPIFARDNDAADGRP